jgi:SAM-dependent methyltransferase
MSKTINKTMDRSDLLTDQAEPIVRALNSLITDLYSRDLHMTSWCGTLPSTRASFIRDEVKHVVKRILNGKVRINRNKIKYYIKVLLEGREAKSGVGSDNRGADYEPLADAVDDRRIPWYLYWEAFWVMAQGPKVGPNTRVLDAGGTSSLFSCFLASLGCEVHSIDLDGELVANANKIARAKGWNLLSYEMNMKRLDFEDEYFDHAYSVCVFEHLDYETKQLALAEIARCLKPNGTLAITFDYRNPAPSIAGYGPDTRPRNQISTKEDIRRNFLSTDHFSLFGNQEFYDNGKSYLVNLGFGGTPYTFGAIFLQKK